MKMRIVVLLSLITTGFAELKIGVLVLNEAGAFHEGRAGLWDKAFAEKAGSVKGEASFDIVHTLREFPSTIGAWAVWPVLPALSKRWSEHDWVLVCEEETRVNHANLLSLLSPLDVSEAHFLGHGLVDREPTIIHHYAFVESNAFRSFRYPDFAGGFLLSKAAFKKLVDKTKGRKGDFSIDVKHELAKLLHEGGIKLTHNIDFCILDIHKSCITYFSREIPDTCVPIGEEDSFYAVKTHKENHKSRIVTVKRTWAKDARNIEYYSDVVDEFIPTISLGVPNTARGHCGKTMAIIKRFAKGDVTKSPWLVIADDDTLLSLPRLRRLIGCYHPTEEAMIIGERYGYGFSDDGHMGYDYPTGGSGMIFSRKAAEVLTQNCSCPRDDSPDDMMIGMCLLPYGIKLVHSAALHQARPPDYALNYIKRVEPVSFHKFWEIDPYTVFTDYLRVVEHKHSEL